MKSNNSTLRSGFFSFALAGAAIAPTHAATVAYDFSFGDWQSSDWSTRGNAGFVNDTGLAQATGFEAKRLRLTDNQGGRAGTAWYNGDRFALDNSDWSFTYQGQISFRTTDGADGIGMHLYAGDFNDSNLSEDGNGATASLITLTIDTYDNGSSDPSAYHMTLWFNGGKLGEVNLAGESSNNFQLALEYSKSTNVLEAYYSGGDTSNDRFISVGNAFTQSQLLELNDVSWGFSAATGGEAENHDILFAAANANTVPEPTASLLGVMGGLMLMRRRRN